MIRRGWLLLALLLAGCGDDDDGGGGGRSSGSIEAGVGVLVLDGERVTLAVTACDLEATTDPGTGVTTELSVTAVDGAGLTVDVVRSSFDAAAPTVTDTVTVSRADGDVLEASRAETGGRYLDLRQPEASSSLVEVDGDVVRAGGVFGTPGGTEADPGNVEGTVELRCP